MIHRVRARWGAPAVLACVLLAGCATNDAKNRIRDVWLPKSQDEWKQAATKGVTLYRADKAKGPVIPAPVMSGLMDAKERLERAGSARAELALVDMDQPNAFAFSFGDRKVIAFTLAWLDKLGRDPDAIAAVMGHELAHIQLGHSATERRKREQSAKEVGQVGGVLLSIIGIPFGGTIAGNASAAYARSFSRDEERAADALGLQWAVRAGFDPCGMERVMRMYEGAAKDTPHPWLSTHPGLEERAAYAAQVAQEAGGKPCR